MASVRRIAVHHSRQRNELHEDKLILRRLESLKKAHRRSEALKSLSRLSGSFSVDSGCYEDQQQSDETAMPTPPSSIRQPNVRSRSRSPLERPSGRSPRMNEIAEIRIREVLHGMDWLEEYLKGETPDPTRSKNVIDFLQARTTGNVRLQRAHYDQERGTRRIIERGLWHEKQLDLGSSNKVFCSQWLNDHEVILGTKCNNLTVLDIKYSRTFNIPCIASTPKSFLPVEPCGIHAVEINPSRNLLATSGENANDLAIYRLPSLEPLITGERAHRDYIFDLKWLDDEYLISGSRDSTLAIWRISEEIDKLNRHDYVVSKSSKMIQNRPLKSHSVVKFAGVDKIRQICHNADRREVCILSLNSQVHLIDPLTLASKQHTNLSYTKENVCLAYSSEHNLYAVGSKNVITVLDARDLSVGAGITEFRNCGIRSLSFKNDILTIGTGNGQVMFYDIRKRSYVSFERHNRLGTNTFSLRTSEGYLVRDQNFYDTYTNLSYDPAVYTHCYDSSGTKLFTAGGPLPATIKGNYAAVWS